jgi:hypothetical protein
MLQADRLVQKSGHELRLRPDDDEGVLEQAGLILHWRRGGRHGDLQCDINGMVGEVRETAVVV